MGRAALGPGREGPTARPGGRLVPHDMGLDPGPAIEGGAPAFALERRRDAVLLYDAAWADWTLDGRLLVATRAGRLDPRDPDDRDLAVIRAHDLAEMTPEPREAPAWVRRRSLRLTRGARASSMGA